MPESLCCVPGKHMHGGTTHILASASCQMSQCKLLTIVKYYDHLPGGKAVWQEGGILGSESQPLCADSDGKIDSFISAAGSKAPASTLKLHELIPGEPYLLGMFLTGAYQEVCTSMDLCCSHIQGPLMTRHNPF